MNCNHPKARWNHGVTITNTDTDLQAQEHQTIDTDLQAQEHQTICEYRGCALERAPDWSRRRCRDPQTN